MATPFTQLIRDERGQFLEALDGSTAVEQAADLARQLMVRRTRRGVDRHGNPFAPYADSTSARGKKTGTVDLTESRRMLDDFVVQPFTGDGGRRRATVAPGTARSARLTRLHTRTGTPRPKLPLRDFAGLTERQNKLVRDQLGSDIRTAVRGGRSGRRIAIVLGGQ